MGYYDYYKPLPEDHKYSDTEKRNIRKLIISTVLMVVAGMAVGAVVILFLR